MALPDTTNVYGNIPSKKHIQEVTAKESSIQGFNYPLEVNPGSGYFSKSTGLKLVKNMIKTFLRTNRGERFMLPDYGADLSKYLMEPLDETTFRLIRDEVGLSVKKYLGELTKTNKLQVFETRDGNLLVKLFLSLRDADSNGFNIEVRI
tara:strand:- start:263 stop:709 length:447 start_codon:yes stop_codon:yes gene_type:complete